MSRGFFAKLPQIGAARIVFRMEFSEIMEMPERSGFIKVGAIKEGWRGNVYVRCVAAARRSETYVFVVKEYRGVALVKARRTPFINSRIDPS